MYFIVKRYFVPEPVWFKAPHWNPTGYRTWTEARDAYIQQRLGNVRAVGITGYPAADISIEYVPNEEVRTTDGHHASLYGQEQR